MDDDSNIVEVDFWHRPEDQFRDRMAHVFRDAFKIETTEGLPTKLTVISVLSALSEVVDEMAADERFLTEEQLTNHIDPFTKALAEFCLAKYGYRILTEEQFQQMRRDIESEITRSTW